MRPSQTFHVLETLRNSSSATLSRKGVELSFDDNQTVLDVYQQWLLLMIDLGYLPPETLVRDSARLWADLVHADVLDLNSAFAECLHLIRMQTVRGFKGLCRRISVHLYSLIREDLNLIPAGDVFAARRLIQLFSYTSRLSLNDIDLTQMLLDDYLRIESQIPDSYPSSITSTLNRILKSWLGTFVPGPIVPHHGPGGIAERGRCSFQQKYELLASDMRLTYAFGPAWWCDGGRPPQCRISKTIFVPKSYKTFRTISMEPATLQYFQQGVWRVIEEQVACKPYLRKHIGFRDQTRNRLLSRQGSMTRNFATIDLSAASDSVGYKLVKELFKGTWLLRYIVATRSTETRLPDGRIIQLKKFAPMGSALCFPIETLIYAALCEHVTRVHHVTGQYSVFGDDIIVPTQCAEVMMRMLEVLGFHVNREKSFYQSTCWFRESCGGEYCDGFDVTPMRVSRKYASRERCVRLAKLISMANTAYQFGYRNLRYFFIRKLQTDGYTAMFAPTELLSDSYTNYHAEQRWNWRYQRIEAKVTTLFSNYSDRDLARQNEEIRYRHWLESTAFRKTVGMGFESVICRPMMVAKMAWRMKPYEHFDQVFIDSSRERHTFVRRKP